METCAFRYGVNSYTYVQLALLSKIYNNIRDNDYWDTLAALQSKYRMVRVTANALDSFNT